MMREGTRVRVKSTGRCGVVAFTGRLHGKSGDFVGVRLDEPCGKNDGSLGPHRYFACEPLHGTFVRRENVEATAPRLSAARSHEANEAYMEEFERGYRALGGKDPVVPEAKEAATAELRGLGGAFDPWRLGPDEDWSKGPRNPEGLLFDASDQPLLCAALSPDARECVVGGADHGLRVFDVRTGREKRNLFSKRYGHREWVTCVNYCPDAAILSAGMDNKLCLWRGTQCVDLDGHRGSISAVAVAEGGKYALSASYDKSVRVWDLAQRKETACLTGHKAPILGMALSDGLLVTGSRDGVALAWDLVVGAPRRLSGSDHKGHVTSLEVVGPSQIASGDQAGTVRLWDLRSRGARPATGVLHAGGAVNEIAATPEGMVVTAGADKRVVVTDPRRLDEPLHVLDHHKDFIYSLRLTEQHILSGAGDGLLLVHDLRSGRLCYGLGANTAGVRCIESAPGLLVAAGDDGNALTYAF